MSVQAQNHAEPPVDNERLRTRITALLASVSAVTKTTIDRESKGGADAIDATEIADLVRELVVAQAELADRRRSQRS